LENAYYYPLWAQVEKVLNFSGLGVRFGSEKNKEFSVCDKSGSSAQSRLNDESLLSYDDDFTYMQTQTLLNKNRSFFIPDPIGFIVQSFGLNRQCFSDSIRTRRSTDGQGWLSTLHPSVFKNVSLVHPFQQLHQVEVARRSTFDVKFNTPSNVCYRSRSGSIMALLLHLLINVRVVHKNHWTKGCLTNTKEFVLLIPGNSEQNFAIAVGVILRLDEKIVMRQFVESSLVVEKPIRIGHFLESN
jgi:hypothetical protein